MRFAFVDAWRHQWRVATLCRVMRVSERGYRSWRTLPISQRARTDMALLAHIREQYSLSLGSYGRPRMTLKDSWVFQGNRARYWRVPCRPIDANQRDQASSHAQAQGDH
jgi:hypothetical protein